MNWLRNILLSFVALALLSGGIANAAMPCCCASDKAPQAQMQIEDGNMDMPCHETQYNQKQKSADCDGCQCIHFVKMCTQDFSANLKNMTVQKVRIVMAQMYYSRQPIGLLQPPKSIS